MINLKHAHGHPETRHVEKRHLARTARDCQRFHCRQGLRVGSWCNRENAPETHKMFGTENVLTAGSNAFATARKRLKISQVNKQNPRHDRESVKMLA